MFFTKGMSSGKQFVVEAESWPQFVEQTSQIVSNDNPSVISWSELDGEEIIAEGGLCNDSGCPCEGSWTHWRTK